MGGALYPQTRAGDADFAARVYLAMLKTFSAAAKGANPRAVVIAGATAPRGGDDEDSTSPQRFARYLRDQRAQRYFDAYSHHVYPWQRPAAKAPDSRRAVALGNLSVLLDLFPGKPFYVTEFGYATRKPSLLGCPVSQTLQAAYLRQAYEFLARTYPRVKAMLWFMVQDLGPAHDRIGAYMGLRTTAGTRKPAWFAFAGGNALTVAASGRAVAGGSLTISGTLSSRTLGRLAGKRLELQRLGSGRSAWTRVSAATTAHGRNVRGARSAIHRDRALPRRLAGRVPKPDHPRDDTGGVTGGPEEREPPHRPPEWVGAVAGFSRSGRPRPSAAATPAARARWRPRDR